MTEPLHPVISKVTLTVQNLEHMLDFYTETLGFQVVDKNPKSASLSADGENVMLILEQLDGAKQRNPRSTGLFHIAFLLPQRMDLADVLQHLIQIRYPLQGASDHDVSEALYLADPEGNGLEIYVDRKPELWTWQGDQVFMTTKALDVENLLQDSSESGWQGMPGETVIGHIHLQVSELESSKEFYCDLLGFDPVLNYGRQALFVSKYKYHHHIGLNTWNSAGAGPSEPGSTGLKHFTIHFSGEEERRAVIAQLEKANAWISTERGIIKTKDPSGIHVILEV